MQSEGSSSAVFIEFNDSRINSDIIIHYFRLRFNFELFQRALDHEQKAGRCPLESPAASHLQASLLIRSSAANRLIGEVVQSRRRPLLGPSPG